MIKRDLYLNRLIERIGNGSVKVVTGIRRCGKSTLLFKLFYDYLISEGIADDHIITYKLDNIKNRKLRDPEILYDTIEKQIVDTDRYFVFLDEVQFVTDFSELVNSLNQIENVDLYVTGSNSRFLSDDILTEFRGRGDEVRIYPLSFAEFYSAYEGDKYEAWDDYFTYGGMPAIFEQKTEEQKAKYLQNLISKVYLSDIIERRKIIYKNELDSMVDLLCSSVGSLTNPSKISKTLCSAKGKSISDVTAKNYLDHLCDAFLFVPAKRYDIKGRKYLSTPVKYYVADVGLRNARLNFRQQEENHIMENIIYNELLIRGYSVDVGIVEYNYKDSLGNSKKTHLEVDFIASEGSRRYYIQSALTVGEEGKRLQEIRPYASIPDSFKKIVVVKDNVVPWHDELGVLYVGIEKFLLDPGAIDI